MNASKHLSISNLPLTCSRSIPLVSNPLKLKLEVRKPFSVLSNKKDFSTLFSPLCSNTIDTLRVSESPTSILDLRISETLSNEAFSLVATEFIT